ncbi:DUF397 domain-containing protein [Streptomyces ipomoeae]|uniref:DUF397 domain-containing protein n=1 Tax=Streptomyces ipomoeae TaxID=103232 RepID=UPI001FD2DF68|nr:DUF397 domain-containing protein [Streptomyces ipomoeae]MDX2938866.1 DUF397 domain-containing protein [Streptomyces ipomoeae]
MSMTTPWQKSSHCSEGASRVRVSTGPPAPTPTIHLTESADPARAVLGTTPEGSRALLDVLKEEKSPRV